MLCTHSVALRSKNVAFMFQIWITVHACYGTDCIPKIASFFLWQNFQNYKKIYAVSGHYHLIGVSLYSTDFTNALIGFPSSLHTSCVFSVGNMQMSVLQLLERFMIRSPPKQLLSLYSHLYAVCCQCQSRAQIHSKYKKHWCNLSNHYKSNLLSITPLGNGIFYVCFCVFRGQLLINIVMFHKIYIWIIC